MSPEARAAAMFRQGKAPAPPAHLDKEAKRLWRSITSAYPTDFFAAGTEPLLEAYVIAMQMHRFYQEMWSLNPGDEDITKRLCMVTSTLNTTAQKLRISNSARIPKKSGILDEKGLPSNVSVLFGGGKERF
jgi:hypothetical protein